MVGSFSEIDFGQTRFNNPTSPPSPSENRQNPGTPASEPDPGT
jgi:hypothetical protein